MESGGGNVIEALLCIGGLAVGGFIMYVIFVFLLSRHMGD